MYDSRSFPVRVSPVLEYSSGAHTFMSSIAMEIKLLHLIKAMQNQIKTCGASIKLYKFLDIGAFKQFHRVPLLLKTLVLPKTILLKPTCTLQFTKVSISHFKPLFVFVSTKMVSIINMACVKV